MGDDFWCKNCLHIFFVCLTMTIFCAGFYPIFPLCFPFEPWWFLCHGFFYSCILCLYNYTFTAYFGIIFPWYFPEKSGTFCSIFRHISMNFSCLIFFVEMSLLIVRFISLIYSFIYSYISLFLFRYFCFLSFKLFSCSYLFIYFLIHVFVKLC